MRIICDICHSPSTFFRLYVYFINSGIIPIVTGAFQDCIVLIDSPTFSYLALFIYMYSRHMFISCIHVRYFYRFWAWNFLKFCCSWVSSILLFNSVITSIWCSYILDDLPCFWTPSFSFLNLIDKAFFFFRSIVFESPCFFV